MDDRSVIDMRSTVDAVYRSDSRAILATLIRLLGDFDAAEEALHDAFRVALEQWPVQGIPANPRAWLISAGRFRAIDARRRRARFESFESRHDVHIADDPHVGEDDTVEDDQLRLIFTCCHPALSPEAQIALTLREVCGLTTEEIARAFLTPTPTMAQRIVRAKTKIRDARIPYQVPTHDELPPRLDAVLRVIYLVFNEGYAASSGDSLTRHDLSDEAIRLGRLLVGLLPEAEAFGLLALMLLQHSRRHARSTPDGDIILLVDQDRSLWDRPMIDEGLALFRRVITTGVVGPYIVQSAIAAIHAEASTSADTLWSRIVEWYDILHHLEPSPVVELNRAVAVAMRDGPSHGIALIDELLERGELARYHFAHSARGELCRRIGRFEDALTSFEHAKNLAQQEPERRFLQRRIDELQARSVSPSSE